LQSIGHGPRVFDRPHTILVLKVVTLYKQRDGRDGGKALQIAVVVNVMGVGVIHRGRGSAAAELFLIPLLLLLLKNPSYFSIQAA
jgi:hypothetical protein